ncbi:MAG: pentapeptide repeat-containing protein [Deltaproteobacteria bacterium]|nr:pentapeptide repeat-containing protein [Deltaproteobacteria bacterium]
MTDLQRLPAGALVEGETFVDVDVKAIGKIELYKCRFENCRLPEAALSRVVLEGCELVGCDLTRISWGSSSLRGVRFVDCKVLGVNFSKAADNPEVSFERCLMRYTVFDGVNLRGARFIDCHLQEASFVEADLQDVDFGGSDLGEAVLKRCALAGADFSTTTGLFFEPNENQSKDAFIAVETAIQIARASGLRVAGHDEPKGSKRKRR